jgi:hypothetical protein
MEVLDCELYLQVEDRHGAIANIYDSPHKTHHVIYYDSTGTRFFREDFKETPIELVERAVIDWATGKRNLEHAA